MQGTAQEQTYHLVSHSRAEVAVVGVVDLSHQGEGPLQAHDGVIAKLIQPQAVVIALVCNPVVVLLLLFEKTVVKGDEPHRDLIIVVLLQKTDELLALRWVWLSSRQGLG